MTVSQQSRSSLPPRLNLGCGADYRDGWWNVDAADSVRTDQQIDLDAQPWDLPPDMFETVVARHVLEHLRDPIGAVEEVCRVLRPGGAFVLTYPIGHTRFEDPTHQSVWNYNTAGVIAGDRAHAHEVTVPLRLAGRDVEWWISQPEPLAQLYTRARLRVCGPGPWLGQVPGLYGEVTATYIHEGEGDAE